jgi:hypothetical protein
VCAQDENLSKFSFTLESKSNHSFVNQAKLSSQFIRPGSLSGNATQDNTLKHGQDAINFALLQSKTNHGLGLTNNESKSKDAHDNSIESDCIPSFVELRKCFRASSQQRNSFDQASWAKSNKQE